MSYENVLNEVQRNPENAFSQMGFITEVDMSDYTQGGQRSVEITCLDEQKKIYKWRVKNQPGNIYYFPYINCQVVDNSDSILGIGHVIVPKGTPDGTIVVSGGMTGCALQVNIFDEGHLIFIHDQNAKAIKNQASVERFIRDQNFGGQFRAEDLHDKNKILCRVEPNHYMGSGTFHYTYNLDKVSKQYPKKGFDMAYYPFFVKVQGIWKLYMSLAGKVGDTKGISGYVKGEGIYLPNIHCVTSFEER